MNTEYSDRREFVLRAGGKAQSERIGQSILLESSEEFVLPDYMPKVEKLLRTESRVLPPIRYTSANEVQYSGNILHSLIYVGDEGEVSATVLPAKYEFSVPYQGTAPTVIAYPVIDSVNCRAVAPRKISIRSKLRVQPRIITECDVSPQIFGGDGYHILRNEIDSVATVTLAMDNITVSDTVAISDSDDAKLIWCGANAAVTDVRVSDSGLQVRGDIYVRLLSADGKKAKMHSKKIPFEEFLDGDISRGALPTVNARVVSTEAGREQGKEALVEVNISLDAAVDIPIRCEAVADVFSEKADVSVEYGKVPTALAITSRSGVFGASGSLPLNAFAGFSEMLDTTGDVTVEDATASDGRIVVSGKCNLHSIYLTESGGYLSAENAIPFKISIDAERADSAEISANASLASVRTRTDGENVVFDCEIALALRAVKKGECDIVRTVDGDNAKPYAKSRYPLCLIYPNGDSLWSLAKKYHVSPEGLAKTNSLEIKEADYARPAALSENKILMLQF